MVQLTVTMYDIPPRFVQTVFAGYAAGTLMDVLWFGMILRFLKVDRSYFEEEENTIVRIVSGILVVGFISAAFGAVVVTEDIYGAVAIGALIGFYVSGTYNLLTMARTSGRYTLLMVVVDTFYGMINLIVVYLVQHWVQHY
jgi:hypothetical protein